eukprot:359188-Chlamydomonas_euryale.AAC.15
MEPPLAGRWEPRATGREGPHQKSWRATPARCGSGTFCVAAFLSTPRRESACSALYFPGRLACKTGIGRTDCRPASFAPRRQGCGASPRTKPAAAVRGHLQRAVSPEALVHREGCHEHQAGAGHRRAAAAISDEDVSSRDAFSGACRHLADASPSRLVGHFPRYLPCACVETRAGPLPSPPRRYDLVDDPVTDPVVAWGVLGTSFVVHKVWQHQHVHAVAFSVSVSNAVAVHAVAAAAVRRAAGCKQYSHAHAAWQAGCKQYSHAHAAWQAGRMQYSHAHAAWQAGRVQ